MILVLLWKVDPVKQVTCLYNRRFILYFATVLLIVPGVVEIVAIVGTSDTTAVVFWTPPSQPNGVITGYQIIYSVYGDADSSMTEAASINENTFVITNLSEIIPPL